MSKLSRDDVVRLAYLARLQLTDDEIDRFTNELSEILGYVEQLDKIETSGLEPTSQVTGLTNVTREDKVIKSFDNQELLKNVADRSEDLIKVNRMIA